MKKTGKQRKKTVYLLTILLSILLIIIGNRYVSGKADSEWQDQNMPSETAKVLEILNHSQESDPYSGDSEITVENILFTAKIISGDREGETISVLQSLNSYLPVKPKVVEVGDKILIYENYNEQYNVEWTFGEYVRTDALMGLGITFAVLLLLFGGVKGLQTLVSLMFTVLAVFLVFIPAVLAGLNIYFWSILVCVYITVMTLILVSGVNSKTIAAIIGCLGGIAFSGVLVQVMDLFLKLTGLVNEDAAFLLLIHPENPIDLKAIFFGAILIGALGAIMDVAMSIASSLYEIKSVSPEIGTAGLIGAAFSIGRDIMGTMANTLILAYIGSSLSIVLLLFSYSSSLVDVLNREMIVVEILQGLVGSMGILLTIPLTALFAGALYVKTSEQVSVKK